MENIDAWEKYVAKKYHLHHSWLRPSGYGEICPCCKKLRFTEHYVSDVGACVFCLAACRKKGRKHHENKYQSCHSVLFYQGAVR